MIHSITIRAYRAVPGQPEDVASVSGAVLTFNGEAFDLSAIPDGGEAVPEGDHPFVGTITRSGSTLSYEIQMAYDTEFPQTRTDWTVQVEDAPVPDLIERGV